MSRKRPLEPKDRFTTGLVYASFLMIFIFAQFLGYSFGYGVESISVLWPPTGVLGAALALLPRKHWVLILVIAAIVDFTSGLLSHNFEADPDFLSYLIVGLFTNPVTAVVFGATFQALIPNSRPLSEPKLFGLYVLVPIVLNTAVVSLLVMSLMGLFIPDFPIIDGWQQWWYSDLVGLLVFATPIILIVSSEGRARSSGGGVLEAVALMLVFTVVTAVLFTTPFEQTSIRYYKLMLMLPVYAWVVARFGAVVMSLTTVVLTAVVLAALVNHASPFEIEGRSPAENVLAVQGFLVPMTLTALFVATILEHRKRQYEALLENERQMRKLSRIESLGTMAAGVAHDFGNLAIAVRAYNSVLKSQLEAPNKAVSKAVKGLEEAADGAQSLTKSLMVFARGEENWASERSEGVPDTSDICMGVEDAVDALRPLIAPKHELVCRAPRDPVAVRISPLDLQRVLSNIILNARDASGQGGRIEVAVRKHDGAALLQITDEGEGMPSEIQERVFDPFFTTKPRGRGTGLGLAVVSGIVHDAGGKIDIASTVGKGTTISITFPVVDQPES